LVCIYELISLRTEETGRQMVKVKLVW
jgi:hypothetical protein